MKHIHGECKPGHKHEFHYDNHGSFSSTSKCKCGAVEITNYSPDGYIGDDPDTEIYEPGSCYFKISGKCNDLRVIK